LRGWWWLTQLDISSRPKDEVLDSMSEFLNALGTEDVWHVVLVSLDDRRHFYLAVVF
jgi:hypothetical protein